MIKLNLKTINYVQEISKREHQKAQ